MNIFFPPNQNVVFMNMAVLGVIIGILYDAFSVKRSLLGDSFFVCFVDDVVFVAVSGVLFLAAVFASNNGIIRWYEFFACISFFLLYKCTVSRIVMKVMKKAAEIIRFLVKKTLCFLFLKLIKPFFKFLINRLRRLIKPLIQIFVRKLKRKKILMSFKKIVCK